ncbi:unnamed protein product, partial [Linum tenue]
MIISFLTGPEIRRDFTCPTLPFFIVCLSLSTQLPKPFSLPFLKIFGFSSLLSNTSYSKTPPVCEVFVELDKCFPIFKSQMLPCRFVIWDNFIHLIFVRIVTSAAF